MKLEVGKIYEVVDKSIFDDENLFTASGDIIENGYTFQITATDGVEHTMSTDFSFSYFGNDGWDIPVYDSTLQDGKVREVV